ncbi:5848_t:CDS:2, partial [Cetraspora pellucida]
MNQSENITNDSSVQDNESNDNDQSDQELISNKKKSLSKSKPSFKNSWLNEFRWLQYDKTSQRMFCKYCKRYNKSNVFGTTGSVNFGRKSSVKEHAFSDQHQDAIRLESAEKIIEKESEQLIEKNKDHIIGVSKIVYTLVRQDIPLAKLPYFVQLSRELKSPFIADGSITYENEISGREFAFAISNIIKTEIWKELSEAVFFGVMIDESTDISMNKHLIAFASDGASVMMGNKNGVAQRLSKICPYIIYTHCIAHRLALACKDSQKQLNYFTNAETVIRDVYKYYKNSVKRIHILQEYQQILDYPELRLKKLKDIRWLGWYDAVENFIKTLPAVLIQLQNDDSRIANDLYQRLCNWRLLGFFHFIYDVLGQLASLNKFFQKRNLYFRDIVPMIDATITNIQKDYIMDTNLSYHLQMFIDHTNPFNENQSEVTYYTHILAYNSCDYDDLLQDVYEYANIVTTKIKDRFPDRLLLAAMKILNPVEWSCKKEELLEF